MKDQVRQRKKKQQQSQSSSNQQSAPHHKPSQKGDGNARNNRKGGPTGGRQTDSWGFTGVLNCAVGLTVMFLLGYLHTRFMITIHENDMWFSNIKNVEREISFRTESGLYYSYYKQMINAPSISQGVQDLMQDNITEHPTTINVLARMNVYQEVALAAIYKSFPIIRRHLVPMYFYIYSIFSLHGLLVCALYAMSWMMSGSWLGGALAALFYIFNRLDTTRVEYVIPLRESFSLPFVWVQLAGITYYFRYNAWGFRKAVSVLCILIGTFCFSVTWQFNQFMLLLQAMALFGTQVLGFVPVHKVRLVYIIQWLSLLAVAALQFNNTMIIGGPVFSFIPAALLLGIIQQYLTRNAGVIRAIFMMLIYIILVFLLTLLLNTGIKQVVHVDSDEHIYKFVLSKFGFAQYHDFDVGLYMCNEAFKFLDYDVVLRMTSHLTFPPYVAVHVIGLLALPAAFISSTKSKTRAKTHHFSRRPELTYHLIQTVFFGAMAVLTLRMKYLWTPYICVLASLCVSDRAFYTWLLHKLSISSKLIVDILRHLLTIFCIGAVIYSSLPAEMKNLENLREFWDPDTVALMEWINKSTPRTASFSGSMQLLAGVKLCTGRPITNHPHYEDKGLRKRTKELYSYYARSPPDVVHSTLKRYQANYIIMEDSICQAGPKGGCRLTDLLDKDRGEVPDNEPHEIGLVTSSVPRFCWKVRSGEGDYGKLFKKVFENKTFKVYEVL